MKNMKNRVFDRKMGMLNSVSTGILESLGGLCLQGFRIPKPQSLEVQDY